ncbi:MAG: MBL fold metallo-hydrolase [Clostridia bacterium]|jgi:ribonuclease BN (tRNA processing enzyme)
MKLWVLGNNGPYPEKNGACSGYLVEKNGHYVLFDMGSGVLANLQKVTDISSLDFVILSHLHFDHMSDMLVLRYMLQLKNMKIDVYLPNEPKKVSDMLICDEFNLIFINDKTIIERDGFHICFHRTTHTVENYSVKVDGRFVYSGDISEPDDLVGFAYGVEMLLCDSAFLRIQKGNRKLPHLSADECGILATKANVRKLLLTHFSPEADKDAILREAIREFPETACTGIMQTYDLI